MVIYLLYDLNIWLIIELYEKIIKVFKRDTDIESKGRHKNTNNESSLEIRFLLICRQLQHIHLNRWINKPLVHNDPMVII